MALSVGKFAGKSFLSSSINLLTNSAFNGSRFLYAKSMLGLTSYEEARRNHQVQYKAISESFRERMNKFIQTPNTVIFTEDLKLIYYLVEKTPEDLELLMNMTKRYVNQQKEFDIRSYTFGPIFMRAMCHLDEPNLAYEAWKTPELSLFFKQFKSQLILMDLLFNSGKYEECLEVYDVTLKDMLSENKFPRHLTCITAACLYKLNTPDSLMKGLEMIHHADSKSVDLPRRSVSFIAALALKQRRPDVSLELLTRLRQNVHINRRCIALEAYAQLRRFEDVAMQIKKTSLKFVDRKFYYFSDSIARIEQEIADEGNNETELLELLNSLKAQGLVQNVTLDENLLSEIPDFHEFQTPRKDQYSERFNRLFNNRGPEAVKQ